MLKKKSKASKNGWDHCKKCKSKMNALGGYEFYCKECNTFYKKGVEIIYTEAGAIIERRGW